MTEDDIKSLQAEMDTFNDQLKAARTEFGALEKECGDVDIVDIAALKGATG